MRVVLIVLGFIFYSGSVLASASESLADNQTVESITLDEKVESFESPLSSFYVGLLGGLFDYGTQGAPAVNGASAGVSLGARVVKSVWLEGDFLYSFSQVNNASNDFEDVDQFSLVLGPKVSFDFFDFALTPVLGFLLSYSHRIFNAGEEASNAFDAGLSLGFEGFLSRSFGFGVEYRWMHNLSFKRQVPADSLGAVVQTQQAGFEYRTIEKEDTSVLLAQLKYYF